MPKQLSAFPGTPETFERLQQLVQKFRDCERHQHRHDHDDGVHFELEARLCTNDVSSVESKTSPSSRFKSGVSGTALDTVLRHVQTNTSLETGDWQEYEDFFFHHGGSEYRMRSTFDTQKLKVKTVIIRKTKLDDCMAAVHTTQYAVRFTLSKEEVIPAASFPEMIKPHHVRIQQRKSVRLHSRGYTKTPTWSIDFGLVWSGKNKAEAETCQESKSGTCYSVELELLNAAYAQRHTPEYVALSISQKVLDLVRPLSSTATLTGKAKEETSDCMHEEELRLCHNN